MRIHLIIVMFLKEEKMKMADSWKEVFEAEVDGRQVKGEVYDEGRYRVTTTQKSDYEGNGSGDESTTVIIPPSAAGTIIQLDCETVEELEKQLVEHGEFTYEEAKNITRRFR